MSPPQKRPPFMVLVVATVLVAAGLGWFLGVANRPTPRSDEAESSRSRLRAGSQLNREQTMAARKLVDGIRRGETPEERLRATIELATSLPVSEFARWMDFRWFDYRDGFELTAFRRILEERWRLEDPEGFLRWCLGKGEKDGGWSDQKSRETAREMLAEWAVDSPGRLDKFLEENRSDSLESQLIVRLATSHPEIALSRLKEMLKQGRKGRIVELRAAVMALADKAPHLMDGILEELPATLRLQAETALVGRRLQDSFADEIRALWQRPDGWALFHKSVYHSSKLGEPLLAELPNLPASWIRALGSAEIYNSFYTTNSEAWYRADLESAGFSSEEAARIRAGALRVLSSREPGVALSLLLASDVQGQERIDMISAIFRRTRTHPGEADAWLAMLTTDGERGAAERAIADVNRPPNPPSNDPTNEPVVYRTPDAWLAGAVASSSTDRVPESFGDALRRWDQAQVEQLTIQFRALPLDKKEEVAWLIHGGSFGAHVRAPDLVGDAIRHLLSVVPNSGAREGQRVARWASTTAVQWVLKDGESASSWVQSLPAGAGRDLAELNLAATWSNYDPEAMERWLAGLPRERQAEIQEFIQADQGR